MAKTKATKSEAQADDSTTLHETPLDGDAPFGDSSFGGYPAFEGDYYNEWNIPVQVVEEQDGMTVVVVRAPAEPTPPGENLSTGNVEVKPTHDD